MQMKCKRCGSQKLVKNGKREWRQCFICKDCKHQFISEFGRHTKQEEQLAVLLYCLGLSFTAISNILCFHTSTVMRWVKRYTRTNCRKSEPKGKIVVELDEMWNFIHSKKLNVGFGKFFAELPVT